MLKGVCHDETMCLSRGPTRGQSGIRRPTDDATAAFACVQHIVADFTNRHTKRFSCQFSISIFLHILNGVIIINLSAKF